MNKKQVVNELKEKYPKAEIICLPPDKPTEIIAEVDPENGKAIAVIDESVIHHHNYTKEKYIILRGELDVYINGIKHHLQTNDVLDIESGQSHYAEGKETWTEVLSTPPWNSEDHILDA